MKRTERHHLKDNELASLTLRAGRAFEARKSLVTTIAAVAGVAAVVAVGYRVWNGRAEARAQALLSESVVIEETPIGPPPAPGTPASGPSFATERERHEASLVKLKAVADQYPSTDAAVLAHYKSAATMMALGRPQEAARAYQEVISRTRSDIYREMARLGLAEAQAQTGEHEKAIGTYKEFAERKEGPVPVDGILMQLGRTYRDAGRNEDAQQVFNRVVEEFPNSPFADEARRELEALKKT